MEKKHPLKHFSYTVPAEFSDPFKDYLKDLRNKRLRILFFFSIFLIPGAFIFDLLIFPEQWLQLLKVRIVSMIACLLLYFISRHTFMKEYPVFLTHLLNIVVAVTIACLTFQTGAYASPYYAGFILIFICMAMVMPLGFKGSLLAGCFILATHLVFNLIPPILAQEAFLWPRFWNSVYFLTFSFTMVLIASAMIQN